MVLSNFVSTLTTIVILFLVLPSHANKPPTFIKNLDLSVVNENSPIGSVIGTLQAYDPENSSLSYGLEGTSLFSVNPVTGSVSVAQSIDRESLGGSVKFNVYVEDIVPKGGRVDQFNSNNRVRVPITIFIIDENDNAPRFDLEGSPTKQNNVITVNISEDSPPGTLVVDRLTARDIDLVGSILRVSCKNCPPHFTVNLLNEATTNLISFSVALIKPISYRPNMEPIELSLTVSDGSHSSALIVQVMVTNVQNKPPVFVGSNTAVISEDIPIGSLVMTLRAIDGDSLSVEAYRSVVYELLTNPMECFKLDLKTGQLRIANKLDKEAFPSTNGVISLKVKAIEVDSIDLPYNNRDDPLAVSIASVTITLQDVNDEAPKFNRHEYQVTIPEGVPNGTPLASLDMLVEDRDTGSNSVFNIALDDASGIFSVEPPLATGSSSISIKVAKGPLDYENPNQRKFILLVTATEAFTKERLSSTSTVTVMIEDVNDNQPIFEEEMYTGTVLEDALAGTIIRTIKATDRDSAKITSLTYSLFGNGAHLFSVHPTTGVITVAECDTPGRGNCIDYETRSSYYLSYQANDGFGQTAVVPLKINVMDSNDNPPVFLRDKYTAIIDEGSTKFEPPLRVKARDPDFTSVITYSLLSGNSERLFSIEPRLGEIKVNQEVRSKEERIILKVQASDGGKGLATADVEITVRDANDNAPVFEKESYTASISESAEPGTVVDRVTATDADSGLNAEINYAIEKGSFDAFTIDPATGFVSVSNSSILDYDRKPTYTIDIIAVDLGVPSRTGTTQLTVNLINDNDKSPYFYPTTQRCQVNEATPPGTRIHRLNATDPDADSAASLIYHIETVQGVDKNGLRIRPHDQNMYEVEKFFTIDSDGYIVVGSKLNRDLATVVTLNVSVTDISSSTPTSQIGFGNIIVTLIDHNDSPPTFSLPWTPTRTEMTFSIVEEVPSGTVVASLLATDLESKIANYTIKPESEYFEINGDSGVLTIKKSIDFEKLPLFSIDPDTDSQINHDPNDASLPLRFTVYAYDSGIPVLSATAKVTVNVININDNEPQFDVPFYNTTVPEDSPSGSVVLKVTAVDRDRGKFGKIAYSIISQSGSSPVSNVDSSVNSDYFIIDSETGVIKVAPGAILDREKGFREIIVQVAATDNPIDGSESTDIDGSRQNTHNRFLSIPVYIRIKDVNDNSPTFTSRDYEGSIFGHFDGSPSLNRIPVLQVSAVDPDEGINGQVAYRIVSGNTRNVFDIDRATGMIYAVKSPLEVNGNVKEYKLRIEARDQSGSGPFFDETHVKIKVIEMNRHKPKFIIPSSPTIAFLENQKPGTKVIRVEAYDEDNGHNGVVRYSFKKDASTNVQETDEFRIDSDSGLITSKISFDREQHDSYELVLSVVDYMGEPQSFENLQKLTVKIKDMDDNKPEFTRHSNTDETYLFTIPENQPRGSLIGKLLAIDRDVIDKRIYYYIVGTNGAPGEFHIDRSTGQLFSNISFDREVQQDYYLVIKASSSPDLSFSDVSSPNELLPSYSEFNSLLNRSGDLRKVADKESIKSRLYDPDDLSLALVHVIISDLNDNKPTFSKPIYRAGINHRAEIGRALSVSIKAFDPDQGVNSSLVYTISSIDLYRKGYDSPDTPVRPIPSPFTIDAESGKIVTAHLMAQYSVGSRFILHLEAREKASPHRTATSKVYLWVYDESKLIKVTIRMKPEAINARKDEIEELLCNATDSRTIINDIRYHYSSKIGRPVKIWSDVYALVVDDRTYTNLSPSRIIAKLDSRADLLSSENQIMIEEISLAGSSGQSRSSFLYSDIEDMDLISIVLMVLVLLLIVGFLSMAVGCCCLRTWYHHKLIESASKAAYKAKVSAMKGLNN
uniref:Cadherin domain-containing protein n=1 Tax=Tetranychus urticae TaxID=32264 RepID=T1L1Z0_TETUR